MPLIVITPKGLKTDTARMCDLHEDIFYQSDSSFSELDYSSPLYKPKTLSKMRGQPTTIDYDVVFIARYKEDIDQMVSNFAVHFRPDVYLKWYHPRVKTKPLTSQLLWSHSVNLESPSDYDPSKPYVVKASTSFTFKSWLFYGMHGTDNSPELDKLITRVKFFPNKTGEGEEPDEGYDEGDDWAFGDIANKDEGTIGFWAVGSDAALTDANADLDKIKAGAELVDSVINSVIRSKDYSGTVDDAIISGGLPNDGDVAGDFHSDYTEREMGAWNRYQSYINMDKISTTVGGTALLKNVYFKGSHPLSAFEADPPSGDYIFRQFFTETKEFGATFFDKGELKHSFDFETNTLKISTIINGENEDGTKTYTATASAEFPSSGGCKYDFSFESIPFNDTKAAYSFHRDYDENYNLNTNTFVENRENIQPVSDELKDSPYFGTRMFIDDQNEKDTLINLRHFLERMTLKDPKTGELVYGDTFELIEKKNNVWWLEIHDTNLGKTLKDCRIIRCSL